MHNCHFYVVEAASGEDACEMVESSISDWGNENNWRVICGAVSEYNEVFARLEGRYIPEENSNILGLNQEVLDVLVPQLTPALSKKLKEIAAGTLNIELRDMYAVSKYIKSLEAYNDTNTKDYNLLYDSWKPYEFDEFGVTIGHDREKPANSLDFIKKTSTEIDTEADRLWVVFIDMHS